MTDDPASFAAFKWNMYAAADFHNKATNALEDERLQTPDMTTREQSYFYRMALMKAKFERRTAELKKVLRIVDKQADEIAILNSKLDHQGTLTKERGAYIWKVLQTLDRQWGAATLEEVDGVKLLMTEAPLEIRIKSSARNPYKLTTDAFKWVIRFAQEAGKKVERIPSTIKKLRCLRFYAEATIPQRIKERRRLPGEPKQVQDWWKCNTANRLAIESRRDTDPGG